MNSTQVRATESDVLETMDVVMDFVSNKSDVVRDEQEYLAFSSQDDDLEDEIINPTASTSKSSIQVPAGSNISFEWAAKAFSPKVYEFDNENCGCKIEGTEENVVLKYFEFFSPKR